MTSQLTEIIVLLPLFCPKWLIFPDELCIPGEVLRGSARHHAGAPQRTLRVSPPSSLDGSGFLWFDLINNNQLAWIVWTYIRPMWFSTV